MAKIYIDAGHGGTDCGAVGVNGVKEKDVNLAVGLYLRTELEWQGHTVKMSRTTDITKSLGARTTEANNFGADLVISIHCNAFDDASANGTETYVYKFGIKAHSLARYVQAELIATLGTKNRGVKTGNLALVRDTVAPAILVELAFITNATDKAKVDSATEQKNCAISICKGICAYCGTTYKGETKVANKTKFKDEAKMSSWAIDSIKKASDAGVMNGDADGNFRPKDNLTREEAAVIVAKLLAK